MPNDYVHKTISKLSDSTRGWLQGEGDAPELPLIGSMKFSEHDRSRVFLYNVFGSEIGVVTRRSATIRNLATYSDYAMTRITYNTDLYSGKIVFHVVVSDLCRRNLKPPFADGRRDISFTFPDYLDSVQVFRNHEHMVLAGYCTMLNLMTLN